MGLSKEEPGNWSTAVLHAWAGPAVVIVVAAALALYGAEAREWLRYDRMAIADGEFWRLLTGHFVHLNGSHFALNAVGLMLVWYLVAAQFSARQWLLIGLLSIAGIDLGFWLWQTDLLWYVGLSGLLHGVLAAGAIAGIASRQREGWILAALLAGKIIYEQWVGPLPGSEQSTGGTVIVSAHLFGAVSGALCALGLTLRKARKAPI